MMHIVILRTIWQKIIMKDTFVAPNGSCFFIFISMDNNYGLYTGHEKVYIVDILDSSIFSSEYQFI